MADLEALEVARLHHPAGTDMTTAVTGSVQSDAANGHEDMAVP